MHIRKFSRALAVAVAVLLPLLAQAEDRWLFEFEFGYKIESSTSRALLPSCRNLIPPEYAAWYAIDPRPGFEVSCGGDNPYALIFLGRRCWKPLPKLVMYCGYRHFSHAFDQDEIEFDGLAVQGRFTW